MLFKSLTNLCDTERGFNYSFKRSMSKTPLTDIQKMYSDGFPSIANKPKVTLAPNSCEKHGRIHFQSGKKNL